MTVRFCSNASSELQSGTHVYPVAKHGTLAMGTDVGGLPLSHNCMGVTNGISVSLLFGLPAPVEAYTEQVLGKCVLNKWQNGMGLGVVGGAQEEAPSYRAAGEEKQDF